MSVPGFAPPCAAVIASDGSCAGLIANEPASWKAEERGTDITPVFEALLKHVPAPHGDPDKTLQIQITSIQYNDYVGRIGVGRIYNGVIKTGQQVGDALVVEEGLKPDDQVIVEGILQAIPGREVTQHQAAGAAPGTPPEPTAG